MNKKVNFTYVCSTFIASSKGLGTDCKKMVSGFVSN